MCSDTTFFDSQMKWRSWIFIVFMIHLMEEMQIVQLFDISFDCAKAKTLNWFDRIIHSLHFLSICRQLFRGPAKQPSIVVFVPANKYYNTKNSLDQWRKTHARYDLFYSYLCVNISDELICYQILNNSCIAYKKKNCIMSTSHLVWINLNWIHFVSLPLLTALKNGPKCVQLTGFTCFVLKIKLNKQIETESSHDINAKAFTLSQAGDKCMVI